LFEYPLEEYNPLPNVACLRLSLLISGSTFSFRGTGGGGRDPAGGAGLIGRVAVVKFAAFALDGPFDDLWSNVFRVVTFGTEFVVAFLPGSPGW
jgi:hypothetical protein